LISRVVESGAVDSAAGLQAVKKLRAVAKDAIPRILDLLSTSRHEETDLLVDLLTRLVDRAHLELLIEGLTDSDSRVTKGVVRALSRAGGIDPNRFLDLLGDPRYSKAAVLEILSAHRQRLQPASLLRYASKLEHNELVMLFRIVGELADESMVGTLINRVDAKNPVLRAQIAAVIARFNTPEVQRTLQEMLHDSNKGVRLAALEGLAQMDASLDVDQLCSLLKDPDLRIQGKAIDTLVRLNHPRTVYYLLDPLQDDSEYARRAAVEVLNEIGDERAIKDLLLAIKDKDWWVRSRAADALGEIGGERVVNSVIKLIKDPDEYIRRTAIEVINATKDPRTFASLVEALGDSDWWVRERAIDGLGELGSQKAVPILIGLLNSQGSDSQMLALIVKALGKLGGRDAVEALIGQLRSSAKEVQHEALLALGDWVEEDQVPQVIEAIREATAEAEEETRELAEKIVARLHRLMRSEPGEVDTVGEAPSAREGGRLGTVLMPGIVSRGAQATESREVDPTALEENDVLADRYRFIRQVGKGAFGAVFLMEDLMVNESLILKFINPQLLSDESIIKRFVYELRFARRITHPNVIRIYDMISFGRSPAIAMEYFPSHTLATELGDSTPLETACALRFLRDICSGMSCAHEANVVHRDLKPSNILINERNEVKIVDFGVAAATSQMDTRLTRTGLLIGTPTYMAPEQVMGRPVDSRTDIYSLGVIMYEAFTGVPPYRQGDSMSIMYQHVRGEAQAPSKINPAIPAGLERVILKAMAADPGQRFQTMAELQDALRACE